MIEPADRFGEEVLGVEAELVDCNLGIEDRSGGDGVLP